MSVLSLFWEIKFVELLEILYTSRNNHNNWNF